MSPGTSRRLGSWGWELDRNIWNLLGYISSSNLLLLLQSALES